MVGDKERKQPTETIKKTPRLVNCKRDFWQVESNKILYMVMRIRELMIEFARHSNGCELKVIIFSQDRESIWRTKVAFAQQNIPTADFIPLVKPRQRIKNLKKFRLDPKVNALLLSSLGSHCLDLPLVTHIFLLEEIWDKSVEMQVISRAHRMGATDSVVVEQLWLKETVECQLTSMNQQLLKTARPTEENEETAQQSTRGGACANKRSFQQTKYNYILNNLRVLSDAICGKENEVRFSVMDENDTIIRQGVHTISESGDVTVSTQPASTAATTSNTSSVSAFEPRSDADTTHDASSDEEHKSGGDERSSEEDTTPSVWSPPHRINAATTITLQRKPSPPDLVVIDDSSSDEEEKREDDESATCSEDDTREPVRKKLRLAHR